MSEASSKHILIVADGRSPTTQSWIRCIQGSGFKVSLVSSYACKAISGLAHFSVMSLAFSRFAGRPTLKPARPSSSSAGTASGIKGLIKKHFGIAQKLRYWLGPLTVRLRANNFQRLVTELQPDIVHALRIPFEGMLISQLDQHIPRIISTWGNDLTLHAHQSPGMRRLTRACLSQADALISDTARDITLAHEWGLRKDVPTLHVPGSGGLDLQQIYGADPKDFDIDQFAIPLEGLWAVNSRGYRPGYVHQDVFFESILLVLAKLPDMRFICPGLENSERQAQLKQQGLQDNIFLLPLISQKSLWALNKRCTLFISPSSHDGTPNSLIESMAAGCYPIVGDIPTLREWIKNGKNGYLVNPKNAHELAQAIISAAKDPSLRSKAAKVNHALVESRADISVTAPKIKSFYELFKSGQL